MGIPTYFTQETEQANYDAEKLREAAHNDDDEPDPTHECTSCRDEVAHIESCPISTYRWCPGECDRVTQWKRLDRKA